MKSLKFFFTICFVVVSFSAFAAFPPVKAGVYGVCGCEGGKSTSSIELRLNEDHTFSYIDNSDPAHALNLAGKWESKANGFVLLASDGNKNFHYNWKYAKNGECITARFGMNFRRICLLKPC